MTSEAAGQQRSPIKISLTPLSGSMSESPPCYLLEIDEYVVLLDTGWDDQFVREEEEEGETTTTTTVGGLIKGTSSWSLLKQRLKKLSPSIDAVLLSHSDTYHLGLLPYLVSKCGLNCPVYATTPIWKMGQMFMYDLYLNHENTRKFKLFDLDDVDSAFDKIVQLEYGETVQLKKKKKRKRKGNNKNSKQPVTVSFTPYPAGHTLGGSLWRISVVVGAWEEELYYIIDHNNKKERHLNGFELEPVIRRKGESSSTLITNSINSLYVQEKRRKRDENLMALLQTTLRIGGNVLIAADTAGRSLELTLMLDQMWRSKDSSSNGLSMYSLVFLNNVAFNVLEFAKEQISWMSEKLQKSFESTGTNPFQLKHVVIAHTLVELSQIPSPKVVITSSPDLESGFSRDLFLQWCQDPHSTVVLTYRSPPGTLARNLIDLHRPGMSWNLDVRQKTQVVSGGNGTTTTTTSNNISNGRKRRWDEVEGDGPTKYLCVRQNFVVNCNVKYIDFEGRSDVEAMVKMVSEVGAGTVVLVRGDPQSTVAMGGLCQSVVPGCVVVNGVVGEEVVLRVGSSSNNSSGSSSSDDDDDEEGEGTKKGVKITITDPLVSSLKMEKLSSNGIIELAWIDGEVEHDNDEQQQQQRNNKLNNNDIVTDKKKKKKTDLDEQLLSTRTSRLKPAPINNNNNNNNVNESLPSRTPLFINNSRTLNLKEFKELLSSNGIESEMKHDGVLIVKCVHGIVYLMKPPDSNEIILECDGLTEEYYRIRELLYGQFAIV